MEEMSDEQFDRFLSQAIPQLVEEGLLDAPGDDAEPIPFPEHVKARVMAKATQLSGMVAAAEARAQGVEINGWEPSPGGDRDHYYMTRPELLEFLEQPQPPSSEEINSAFERMREIRDTIRQLKGEREQILHSFLSRAKANPQIQEADSIVAASLITRDPNKMEEKHAFLTSIKESVEQNRGGLIAWTNIDLGHSEELDRYSLHIGRLPEDASLRFTGIGNGGVPVSKSVRMRFYGPTMDARTAEGDPAWKLCRLSNEIQEDAYSEIYLPEYENPNLIVVFGEPEILKLTELMTEDAPNQSAIIDALIKLEGGPDTAAERSRLSRFVTYPGQLHRRDKPSDPSS